MPDVDIGGTAYPSYATVDFADEYLAADALRAAGWAGLTEDGKGRSLVSATRLLQRLCWSAGQAPLTDDPALDPLITEATSLMAADIASKPSLGDSASTGTDLKRAKAGPAEVEFFRNFESTPLPTAAWQLLLQTGMLCENAGASDDGLGAGIITGSGYPSRFDGYRHDYYLDDCPPEIGSY